MKRANKPGKKKAKNGSVDLSVLFHGNGRSDSEKIRGLGVLLENIDSKMDNVIEVSENTRVSLEAKIDGVEQRLTGRIDLLETAVTAHSKEIKGLKVAVAGNSADIKGLKTDVAGLKTDVAGLKSDVARLDGNMHAMEGRLTAKIDGHAARLNDHETRITTLETTRL